MKVARRIRYISAEGSPRVATVDMDQDLDAALSLMEAMGERILRVDVLELEPRSLLEDIVAFVDTDPDARAVLDAKRAELERECGDFGQWMKLLVGNIYGNVMHHNNWTL